MQRSYATMLVMVARLCWLLSLVVGLLYWTGNNLPLALHISLGLLAALSLLALALGARRLAPRPSSLAIAVVVLLPTAGLLQEGVLMTVLPVFILPALHLLLALAAIAFAEILAKKLRTQAGSVPRKI